MGDKRYISNQKWLWTYKRPIYDIYKKNRVARLGNNLSFGKKGNSHGARPCSGIIEYTLNNNSKYMVICFGGVWEFLSNEDVMKIGNKDYRRKNILIHFIHNYLWILLRNGKWRNIILIYMTIMLLY